MDHTLTPAQVEQVEKHVNDKISRNLKVHTYVAPLDKACEIFGLRRVPNEQYPDPVRVVSVGMEVETLLEAPETKDWADFSLEFCGGTHLEQTGDAEVFAIVEESSISQGVRRITGVTRGRAREAFKNGEALLQKANSLSSVPEGPELDEGIKGLQKEIVATQISLVQKNIVSSVIDSQLARLLTYRKNLAKQKAAAAVSKVKEMAAELKTMPFVVLRLDGLDSKTNSKVTKELQKINKNASFLVLAADPSNDTVSLWVNVCKSHQGELDALKWCQAALAPLGGGKAGGRVQQANGTAPGADRADEVTQAARQFVKL